MGKKRITASDVKRMLGEDKSATGRKPIRPKGVDGRLDQLRKQNDSWFRLFCEVWFNPSDPLIELAVGASELPDLCESYDAAIESMQWIAASALYAGELLEKGKAAATKKIAAKKKVGGP